ncbi:MAG: Transcriptional regulatory protein CpxR [Steroidobacteraceae bacterium]|nr:Transcriptional regulatory protein CpxR [Steroidobacteraceae bacterium]
MQAQLLLIDDDRDLCAMLEELLGGEGFGVASLHSGPAALAHLEQHRVDLVVLDVMLPGMSGFDVLRELRRRSVVPVLMLTARGDAVDRIVGLEVGADDYLAKPFHPRELIARIRAILRRPATAPAGAADRLLTVGPLVLDLARGRATVDERPVALTGAEVRVLEELMRSAGQVLSRQQLCDRALGRPLEAFDRSIDTHVANLRRKLGEGAPQIRGVRGAGYAMDPGEPG